MEKALPKGLKLITGYSPLGAGSSRVSNVIENTSDIDIPIPAKTIALFLKKVIRECPGHVFLRHNLQFITFDHSVTFMYVEKS